LNVFLLAGVYSSVFYWRKREEIIEKREIDLKELEKLIYSKRVAEIRIFSNKPIDIVLDNKTVSLNHFAPTSKQRVMQIIEDLGISEKALKDFMVKSKYKGNLLEICVSPDKEDMCITCKK
jgi:hypothetical protein